MTDADIAAFISASGTMVTGVGIFATLFVSMRTNRHLVKQDAAMDHVKDLVNGKSEEIKDLVAGKAEAEGFQRGVTAEQARTAKEPEA